MSNIDEFGALDIEAQDWLLRTVKFSSREWAEAFIEDIVAGFYSAEILEDIYSATVKRQTTLQQDKLAITKIAAAWDSPSPKSKPNRKRNVSAAKLGEYAKRVGLVIGKNYQLPSGRLSSRWEGAIVTLLSVGQAGNVTVHKYGDIDKAPCRFSGDVARQLIEVNAKPCLGCKGTFWGVVGEDRCVLCQNALSAIEEKKEPIEEKKEAMKVALEAKLPENDEPLIKPRFIGRKLRKEGY